MVFEQVLSRIIISAAAPWCRVASASGGYCTVIFKADLSGGLLAAGVARVLIFVNSCTGVLLDIPAPNSGALTLASAPYFSWVTLKHQHLGMLMLFYPHVIQRVIPFYPHKLELHHQEYLSHNKHLALVPANKALRLTQQRQWSLVLFLRLFQYQPK